MRKAESLSQIKHPFIDAKSDYYRSIGEQAAVYTFTKSQLAHKKLSSISANTKSISKTDDIKKVDPEITSFLSPLSRDISHLRDKFQSVSVKHSELPLDINTVKKLLRVSDSVNKGLTIPYSCRKELCLDLISTQSNLELPSIDKMFLGPPTGRQETSNLKKWFHSMKESYAESGEENLNLLHLMCFKELIRQVSVQCIDRGELLNEVLEFFIVRYEKLKGEVEDIQGNAKIRYANLEQKSKNIEKELREKVTSLEHKNKELMGRIDKKLIKIKRLSDEVLEKDERIEELLGRFFDDEENNLRAIRTIHRNVSKHSYESSERPSLIKKNTLKLNTSLGFQKHDQQTQTEFRNQKVSDVMEKNIDDNEEFCNSQELYKNKEEKAEEIKGELDLSLQKSNPEENEDVLGSNAEIRYDAEILGKLQTATYSMQVLNPEDTSQEKLLNPKDINAEKPLDPEDFNAEKPLDPANQVKIQSSAKLDLEKVSADSPQEKLHCSAELDQDRCNSGKQTQTEKNLKIVKGINSIFANFSLGTRKNSDYFSELDVSDQNSEANTSNIQFDKPDSSNFVQVRPKAFGELISQDANQLRIPANKHKSLEESQFLKSEKLKNSEKLDEIFLEKQEKFRMIDIEIRKKRRELKSLSKRIEEKINESKSILNHTASSPDRNKLNQDSYLNDSCTNSMMPSLTKKFSVEINDIDASNQEDISNIFQKSLSLHLETPNKSSQDQKFVFPKTSEGRGRNLQRFRTSLNSKGVSRKNSEGKESAYDTSIVNSSDEEKIKEASEYKKKNLKRGSVLAVTEIAEFNFNHRKNKEIVVKKNPARTVLSKLIGKKSTWIKKRATMSRKMINKTISSLYLSYASKGDYSESLLEFTYDEFSQRFGFKKVVDKKFIEFLCSLISNEDSRRCKIFLRFVHCGSFVSLSDFAEDSLKHYLSCFNFMLYTKIGIATIDDAQDKIMLPYVRAVECIREQFDNLDRTISNKLINYIEKKIVSDPKKINSQGLIENELVLELIVEKFEEIRRNIISGVEMLVNTLKYNENKNNLKKPEVAMFFRVFLPSKIDEIEQIFSEKELINTEEFVSYCIEKLEFSIHDIASVIPDKKYSDEEAEVVLKECSEKASLLLDDLKEIKNLTPTHENLIEKLNNFVEGISNRSAYENQLALYIFSNEVNKIKNTSP